MLSIHNCLMSARFPVFICSVFKVPLLLFIYCLGLNTAYADGDYDPFYRRGEARYFHAPIGTEAWKTSISRLRCELSLKIHTYGVAYFEQFATKDPHFKLTDWQGEEHSTRAEIWSYPPVWRPKLKPIRIAYTTIQDEKTQYAAYLERSPTLKMLVGLTKGYKARIKYRSDLGYIVRVDLSPINFFDSYLEYIACVGNLLPFNFNDVKRTVFHFNTEGNFLTLKDKRQLGRIALYMSLDESVKAVRIAGYTDNTGRRGVNNAISEQRAKAVANYLLEKGVPENKVRVTWYGMLYPVATNDTEEGRTQNRRVVIELIK